MAAGVGFAVCLFAIRIVMPPLSDVPLKPGWPRFSQEYISTFNGTSITHHLVAFGHFGVGNRINAANFLIFGNSHAQLGISSTDIKRSLEKEMGLKISAYNASVGWGEGSEFIFHIVPRLTPRCRVLLFEMHNFAWPLSPPALEVLGTNRLKSFLKVVDRWLEFGLVWILDGRLSVPRIDQNGIRITRPLNQSIQYRSWETGDLIDYWSPTFGIVFSSTAPSLISYPSPGPFPGSDKSWGDMQKLNYFTPENLKRLNVIPLGTYIPFNEHDGESARYAAVQLNVPFLQIVDDGIELYDKHHTNKIGRLVATSRIIAGIREVVESNGNSRVKSCLLGGG